MGHLAVKMGIRIFYLCGNVAQRTSFGNGDTSTFNHVTAFKGFIFCNKATIVENMVAHFNGQVAHYSVFYGTQKSDQWAWENEMARSLGHTVWYFAFRI